MKPVISCAIDRPYIAGARLWDCPFLANIIGSRAPTGIRVIYRTRYETSTQPTPEVPQWYVFRSGEAKGPYTRLQLWEIQEITGRTEVWRGEADWQRAGEIPELAAYLTQK